MGSRPRRRRAGPTEEWEQVELLCAWPEQSDYELIRPMVLFGASADGRFQETGASSERTLRRRAARFRMEGVASLFGSGTKPSHGPRYTYPLPGWQELGGPAFAALRWP